MEEEERYSLMVRGDGVNFKRIRRITGYLVDGLERFNSGKRAEEKDRVKHMGSENNNIGGIRYV